MKLYAVIPTRGRNDLLRPLVGQLLDEGVAVIVVDNNDDQRFSCIHPGVFLIGCEQNPPNLSHLWNVGLLAAHANYQMYFDTPGGDYAVAVLNDDVVLPPRFVQAMAAAIESTGAAVAYPDQHSVFAGHRSGEHRELHIEPGPVPLQTRMCGYAFVLRGSANLLADENLQWWYGDDDLDWRARQNGGSCLVGGISVQHLHPNESTNANPELSAQAGRDRQTFIDKWGRAPW